MANRQAVTKSGGIIISGDELYEKRERISEAVGRTVTQAEIAEISGISYSTYILAETYSVIRGKTRMKVLEWIEKNETEIINLIRRKDKKG